MQGTRRSCLLSFTTPSRVRCARYVPAASTTGPYARTPGLTVTAGNRHPASRNSGTINRKQLVKHQPGEHIVRMRWRARDLPETAPHVPSRRPIARSSAPPFTWAVVWSREVLRGGVNPRRIDGKDGVAGSIAVALPTDILVGRTPLGRYGPRLDRREDPSGRYPVACQLRTPSSVEPYLLDIDPVPLLVLVLVQPIATLHRFIVA